MGKLEVGGGVLNGVYVCVCVCARARVCVCVCGDWLGARGSI